MSNTPSSQRGAPGSETLRGPPDKMIPAGRFSRIAPAGVVHGKTCE
jgi:hypothetical protein